MRRRTTRLALAAAIVAGVALRLAALRAPYLHPDQELLPSLALRALAHDDWDPRLLVYPSGFIYLLRATYALAWKGALGPDRLAPIDAFLADPFPFLFAARAWSCAAGIATVALAGALGRRLAGGATGALAALLTAVSFLAVRESHYGSVDAAATALYAATLVVLAAYGAAPSRRRLVAAGLLAGVTAGFRYQLGILAPAIALAAVVAPGTRRRTLVDVALAGAASALAFTLVTPYAVFEPAEVLRDMHAQLATSWSDATFLPPGLPVSTMLAAAVGPVACTLAAIGVAATVVSRARLSLPLLAASVPYAVALLAAPRAFLRYLLPLVPVLATFAAVGTRAVAGLVPRRAAGLAGFVLVVAAAADPLARSLALDRLLATEDTRVSAGIWLKAHHPVGVPLWLPTRFGYGNPLWGRTTVRARGDVSEFLKPLVERYAPGALGYPPVVAHSRSGARVDHLARGGAIVVTAEHPLLPQWVWTAPAVREILESHGHAIARFDAIDPGVAPADVTYEPIDANFIPLRGFEHVPIPGPNIVIWWVKKPPPQAR